MGPGSSDGKAGPNYNLNWRLGAAIEHGPDNPDYLHSWDGKAEIFFNDTIPDCNAPVPYYCYLVSNGLQ